MAGISRGFLFVSAARACNSGSSAGVMQEGLHQCSTVTAVVSSSHSMEAEQDIAGWWQKLACTPGTFALFCNRRFFRIQWPSTPAAYRQLIELHASAFRTC